MTTATPEPVAPTSDPETHTPLPEIPPRLEGEPEAIFVVGASRSGTTLMRTLLELSDRIAIARENHYIGHLRESEGARFYFRRAGDLAEDETIRKIVEMIYGGDFQRRSRWREVSTFWNWLQKSVARDEMERRLLAAERTERGIFVAFMRAYADRKARPIIGEKTPPHLAYVETLLEWFPSGRVVHMLRDPRAVYVSDLRRRRNKLRKPYSWFARLPGFLPMVILVQTALVWRGAVKRHVDYEERFPDRYRLVRFEDLVREPLQTLSELYKFLGVAIPADPTDVKVVSQGFRGGEHGLDAAAADRWRKHISGFSRRFLELILRGPMRAMGYLPEKAGAN